MRQHEKSCKIYFFTYFLDFMKAIIVSIGDEILIGQTINTNAAWLGSELNQIGIKVINHFVSQDNLDSIINILNYSTNFVDLIIITGGLGPTKDDITKVALCQFFGSRLVLHQDAYENLKRFYQDRGRDITETNIRQAYVPDNAKILHNSVGAAPGTMYNSNGKTYFSLPGVPSEMKAIFTESIRNILLEKTTKDTELKISNKVIYTVGIPESTLSDKLSSIENNLVDLKLAYLPSYRGVKLRIDGIGKTYEEINENINYTYNLINNTISEHIIEEEMDILNAISYLLKTKNLTISTAESCTGGLLGQLLTSISGSSDYFIGGLISYSNQVKMKNLGVNSETLEKFGAVSDETATEMAINCRDKFKTDFAISVTGIAGPLGGSAEKPVGTVFIGISSKYGVEVQKFLFGKNRDINRELSCTYALYNLYKLIKSKY